jgi:hypothetical protein
VLAAPSLLHCTSLHCGCTALHGGLSSQHFRHGTAGSVHHHSVDPESWDVPYTLLVVCWSPRPSPDLAPVHGGPEEPGPARSPGRQEEQPGGRVESEPAGFAEAGAQHGAAHQALSPRPAEEHTVLLVVNQIPVAPGPVPGQLADGGVGEEVGGGQVPGCLIWYFVIWNLGAVFWYGNTWRLSTEAQRRLAPPGPGLWSTQQTLRLRWSKSRAPVSWVETLPSTRPSSPTCCTSTELAMSKVAG